MTRVASSSVYLWCFCSMATLPSNPSSFWPGRIRALTGASSSTWKQRNERSRWSRGGSFSKGSERMEMIQKVWQRANGKTGKCASESLTKLCLTRCLLFTFKCNILNTKPNFVVSFPPHWSLVAHSTFHLKAGRYLGLASSQPGRAFSMEMSMLSTM